MRRRKLGRRRAAAALAVQVLDHEKACGAPDPKGECEVYVCGGKWKRWLQLAKEASDAS